jgi:hypothetical protein
MRPKKSSCKRFLYLNIAMPKHDRRPRSFVTDLWLISVTGEFSPRQPSFHGGNKGRHVLSWSVGRYYSLGEAVGRPMPSFRIL